MAKEWRITVQRLKARLMILSKEEIEATVSLIDDEKSPLIVRK